MAISETIRAAAADALALIIPVDCAGCGAPDAALCATCAAELVRPQSLRRTLPSGLAVRAAFRFDGVAARTVRALKEDGRTSLARPLGAALAVTARDAGWSAETLFVGVPTSRAAFRRRGYRVVDLLLRRSGLARVSALRPTRAIADQRALGRDERGRNVAGSLRASSVVTGRAVVVVDDVVTTGATLDEAARALRRAGAHVEGALCFALTERWAIGP